MQKPDATNRRMIAIRRLARIIELLKRGNGKRRRDPHGDSVCSGGYNEAFVMSHWTRYTPNA